MQDPTLAGTDLASARPLLGESEPRSYSMRYRWYTVLLMTLAYTMYTADRVLLGVLVEPIKAEFGVSDSQMGLVSLLAATTYALFVIPMGLLADRVNRRNMLVVILTGWSILTGLSGFVRNIVQLAMTQMLVTLNEGGGGPTMSSLISDLFPRARRGLPISVWYCGISLGAFVGYSGGGYLADQVGWRMTFILLGVPGLLIAALVWLTVRETPRGMADGSTHATRSKPDFRGTLQFLKTKKALRHAVLAQCFSGIAFMGPIYWLVSFFLRTHETTIAETGMIVGLIFLITGVISAPVGGFFMDRLGQRDVRWHGWLCVILMLTGGTAMLGIYILPTAIAAYLACTLWQLLTNAVSPINVTIISNLAPAQYRGVSQSIGFLLFHFVGFGIGSQLIGAMSDWLAVSWGFGEKDALRYACLSMVAFHAWAAFHFWVVAKHAKEGYQSAADMERAAATS